MKHADGLFLGSTGLDSRPLGEMIFAPPRNITEIYTAQLADIQIFMDCPFSAGMHVRNSGTDGVNTCLIVSASKDKNNAPAGDSGNRRQKRRKEKLIRLDDLIPKENVVGGRQLFFGSSYTTIT